MPEIKCMHFLFYWYLRWRSAVVQQAGGQHPQPQHSQVLVGCFFGRWRTLNWSQNESMHEKRNEEETENPLCLSLQHPWFHPFTHFLSDILNYKWLYYRKCHDNGLLPYHNGLYIFCAQSSCFPVWMTNTDNSNWVVWKVISSHPGVECTSSRGVQK